MTQTESVKSFYAEPYQTAKSRAPLEAWRQDVPFAYGKTAAETAAVKSWAPWLAASSIPKLALYVTSGVAIKEKDVEVIKKTFQNTELVYLGEGLHFIQEDYPHEIGTAISDWLNKKGILNKNSSYQVTTA